jgi:putative endonuclease
MKGYLYILRCAKGQYYTGSTTDIARRLAQHQSGEGANFTRKHLPVELVYLEEFSRIDEAFYREKQVQGWSRKKKEALIHQQYEKLPELSRNYTQFTLVAEPVEATTVHADTSISSTTDTSTSSVSEERNTLGG